VQCKYTDLKGRTRSAKPGASEQKQAYESNRLEQNNAEAGGLELESPGARREHKRKVAAPRDPFKELHRYGKIIPFALSYPHQT
jgi:hypothetical protein